MIFHSYVNVYQMVWHFIADRIVVSFLLRKDWDGSSENASPNPSDVEALALRMEDGYRATGSASSGHAYSLPVE